MKKGKKTNSKKKKAECMDMKCGCGHKESMGGFYFLGFLGSAIYFIQETTGFWAGVLGVIKAIVWPAFLVHHLFGI
jgi:hypothetical protein